jgi:hypothetical protein
MLFLKFKQIMPFDKADTHFLSNNNSCELKVMIISLHFKTVWLNRNVKQFENKNVN